jgi:hypothetical protein
VLVELEKFIFPDTCEVLKLEASQEFVFPIFKNGSSSLRRMGTYIRNEAIADIREPIIVFLRDPEQRFLSGVNTYVQHLHRDNNNLDTETILYFVKNYLFLNNHYAPQFFWLLNLGRFINPETELKLTSFADIGNYTDYHNKAGVESMNPQVEQAVQHFDKQKLELYYFLDRVLIDRIGKNYTLASLIFEVKRNYPELYHTVFGATQRLHNVLS